VACPESRPLARGERRVRNVRTGAYGVAEIRPTGWVSVLWDEAEHLGPADYYGPITAGWLEVVS
jgi:hypothetical protein